MRDPSMEQTAAGLDNTRGIDSNLSFSGKEIGILRGLAFKVAELAARPVESVKKNKWIAHNDLETTEPLIFCDPENGWNEIITQDQILCANPLARVWEMTLRKEIFWGEKMKDDRVIEPYFNVSYNYSDSGYGIAEEIVGGQDGGSFIYNFPIRDYEEDFPKLQLPEIEINYAKTREVYSLAEELFDGLLKVRMKGIWWWTLGMTWDFIKLRGLENLMVDMMIQPEWVHKLMDFLCKAVHHKLDFLEKEKLLFLNTQGSYVGSGGFGWTKELPMDGFNPDHVRLKDMWGFAESQETVVVSPEMYGEFVYPYQETILRRFGLNCYGCCEPIDPRWKYVKNFPRLRRVSVSPWANVKRMAEFLENKYVLSIKPSPTPLASKIMDETVVRKELSDKLEDSRGCCVEIIMKDNHTLGNNAGNAVRWCEIAREEINKIVFTPKSQLSTATGDGSRAGIDTNEEHI